MLDYAIRCHLLQVDTLEVCVSNDTTTYGHQKIHWSLQSHGNLWLFSLHLRRKNVGELFSHVAGMCIVKTLDRNKASDLLQVRNLFKILVKMNLLVYWRLHSNFKRKERPLLSKYFVRFKIFWKIIFCKPHATADSLSLDWKHFHDGLWISGACLYTDYFPTKKYYTMRKWTETFEDQIASIPISNFQHLRCANGFFTRWVRCT